MSENYRAMWSELGLNLKNHDMLMDVLGKVYADIFLSRKTGQRKQSISHFRYVRSTRA